jgi:hypothetical protein
LGSDVVKGLRQLPLIRARCRKIYSLALQDKLKHLTLHEEQLDGVVAFVHSLIKTDYPNLNIPPHSRWRHFEAGGVARHLEMQKSWNDADALEVARRHIDLVVVSVLLDAGAGAAWQYRDDATAQTFGRSEGLGIASLRMFAQGMFSASSSLPHRVDASALEALKLSEVETGFQVTKSNPMVGLEGRVQLLKNLGAALRSRPDIFAHQGTFRPGHLLDFVLSHDSASSVLPLSRIWHAVIEGLQQVWPTAGRIHWDGVSLGDVWHHSALGPASDPNAWIPFHKLSQWLTYSLLEPLNQGGFTVSGLEDLTGLPEYRNGGLFLDFGVLRPRDSTVLSAPLDVSSEWTVEWRALTVLLLDAVAQRLRDRMALTADQLPLAKVLEAGTWKAGRRIAAQKREGGGPPVQVISDGTVF